MTTDDSDTGSTGSNDQVDHDQQAASPDALPSGAGPQAEEDQSDIASGGGSAS